MGMTPEVAAIKAALKDFPVSVRIKRSVGRRSFWQGVRIIVEKDSQKDGFYRFGEDCAARFNDCFPGLYQMDPDCYRIQLDRDAVRTYLNDRKAAAA